MKLRDNRDLALYAGIAAFSTAEHYVATGQIPKTWEPFIGISLAILIAIKAKLSKPNPDDPTPQSGTWAVARLDPPKVSTKAPPEAPTKTPTKAPTKAPVVDLEAVPVGPVGPIKPVGPIEPVAPGPDAAQ